MSLQYQFLYTFTKRYRFFFRLFNVFWYFTKFIYICVALKYSYYVPAHSCAFEVLVSLGESRALAFKLSFEWFVCVCMYMKRKIIHTKNAVVPSKKRDLLISSNRVNVSIIHRLTHRRYFRLFVQVYWTWNSYYGCMCVRAPADFFYSIYLRSSIFVSFFLFSLYFDQIYFERVCAWAHLRIITDCVAKKNRIKKIHHQRWKKTKLCELRKERKKMKTIKK